jgi:hypothetical protein
VVKLEAALGGTTDGLGALPAVEQETSAADRAAKRMRWTPKRLERNGIGFLRSTLGGRRGRARNAKPLASKRIEGGVR